MNQQLKQKKEIDYPNEVNLGVELVGGGGTRLQQDFGKRIVEIKCISDRGNEKVKK